MQEIPSPPYEKEDHVQGTAYPPQEKQYHVQGTQDQGQEIRHQVQGTRHQLPGFFQHKLRRFYHR